MKRWIAQFFWRRKVRATVAVFQRLKQEDGQEELLRQLGEAGLAPEQAWRLYQFVPIAFCHAVLGHRVQFPGSYIAASWTNETRVTRQFRDEPMYVAAAAEARRLMTSGAGYNELLPVFGISAEFHVINEMLRNGGRLEALVMTETLLFGYEEKRCGGNGA